MAGLQRSLDRASYGVVRTPVAAAKAAIRCPLNGHSPARARCQGMVTGVDELVVTTAVG